MSEQSTRASESSVPGQPAFGHRYARFVPGIALAVALGLVASLLGSLFPVVGGPVFGITLGMLVQTLRSPGAMYRPGIAFAAKYVLQASVVLLGLGLGLNELLSTGVQTFPVMIGTLAAALAAAYVLGRMLKVSGELQTLIGAGTAICGGSAIAATSAVIGASQLSITYAVSTIFIYNALAVLIFPALGHLMELSQTSFGIWAGTAINDTSSVVAAGYIYGDVAGETGTIVKLARTTMIIPITILLAALQARTLRKAAASESRTVPWKKLVPWFIVWFCLATALNTVGFVPTWLAEASGDSAKFMITVALTAVGLSAQFRAMHAAGYRPLILGGLLWMVVAVSSLVLQQIFGLL